MGVNARYFLCAVAFFLEHRVTTCPCQTASTEEVVASSDLRASPGPHPSNVQVSCWFGVPANVACSIIANPDHHHQLYLLGYAHWQKCATACQLNKLTCTLLMSCFVSVFQDCDADDVSCQQFCTCKHTSSDSTCHHFSTYVCSCQRKVHAWVDCLASDVNFDHILALPS